VQRYRIRCSTVLLLTKEIENKKYVLLQHRHNVKVLNNTWDLSAGGHLEKGETLKDCVIRESKEEIGISINKKDLHLVNMLHINFKDTEYIIFVFNSRKWKGKEKIMEPEKCDKLKWFEICDLPENIIDNRKRIIDDYLANINYREAGF